MKYPGRVISVTKPTANSSVASGIWLPQDQMQGAFGVTWPGSAIPALYTFTDMTIAPLVSSGIYGRTGPSLAQLVSATTSTGDSTFKNNTTYFNATSGIISWMVPATGTYRIEVWGARGGNGQSSNYLGGYGARMRGDFSLTRGDIIKIMIGQMGGPSYGGGGGGTFVATNANVPLIVAGGGNTLSPWSSTPVQASTGTNGVNGSVAFAGSGGGGGSAGGSSAAGGAGFNGNGTNTSCGSSVAPLSFVNGGTGGQTCNSIGGFGGGSGSDGCCQGASGAGGGYSGGAGCNSGSQYGGAGGSYNDGTNQSNDAGNTGTATRSDNGQVIITRL